MKNKKSIWFFLPFLLVVTSCDEFEVNSIQEDREDFEEVYNSIQLPYFVKRPKLRRKIAREMLATGKIPPQLLWKVDRDDTFLSKIDHIYLGVKSNFSKTKAVGGVILLIMVITPLCELAYNYKYFSAHVTLDDGRQLDLLHENLTVDLNLNYTLPGESNRYELYINDEKKLDENGKDNLPLQGRGDYPFSYNLDGNPDIKITIKDTKPPSTFSWLISYNPIRRLVNLSGRDLHLTFSLPFKNLPFKLNMMDEDSYYRCHRKQYYKENMSGNRYIVIEKDGNLPFVSELFEKQNLSCQIKKSQNINDIHNLKIEPLDGVIKLNDFDNFVANSYTGQGPPLLILEVNCLSFKKEIDLMNFSTFPLAVKSRKIKVVNYWIKKVNHSNLNKLGNIALRIAISGEDLPMVRHSIGKLGAKVDKKDSKGDSFFHAAVKNGNIPIAWYLGERSEDVNSKNLRGDTALHIAVENKNAEMVQFLVNELGVDLNIPNLEGYTPLYRAIYSKEIEIVKFLGRKIKEKIEGKVEMTDDVGSRCFHEAMGYNDHGIAKFLINELGVDPNTLNPEGHNALYSAIEGYHPWIANLLVTELKMDSTKKENVEGNSSFYKAVKENKVEIVQIFIENLTEENKNDYISETNPEGNTTLHIAVENRNTEMVQLLVENLREENKNGYLNRKNNEGHTAFWIAKNKLKTAKALEIIIGCFINEEININEEDMEGISSEKKDLYKKKYLDHLSLLNRINIKSHQYKTFLS